MKNTVYKSASIVTALSVAERGLGFLYRIVLSRLIGAEGLGLYQVALSLFALFLTFGTGGIPITVSRMISKSKAENDPYGERRAVSAGICLCLMLTLPFCFILSAFGDKMTFLFSDERSFGVFRILLLGLACSSVYAVIRGSFWGNKEFLTPSILEIAEETVMVIAGVLLLRSVPSPAVGAEKAAWAVVISYFFSFTASMLCFFFRGGKLSTPKTALKPLFKATMPITSVRASGSLVNSAVAVLLPVMLLRTGVDKTEALRLFGIVSGMVLPVLFIPSTLIGSLSLVLVPELSEDFYRKKYERLRKNLERGLSATLLISCILIPFFYALGEDVGRLAFSEATAGKMIVKSSLILLPMSVTMISTSMLNSLGFEKQTFAFYFFGAASMIVCILVLPTFCGVYAYIVGLGASYILTAVCNLVFLYKKGLLFQKTGEQVCVPRLLFPAIAILPLSFLGRTFCFLFKGFAGQTLSVVFTAFALAISTAILYVLLGIIPIKKKNRRKNTVFS